jgi:hypothetical protein
MSCIGRLACGREILETIRDGEHHSYQQQKSRRDQHSQDDPFLLRT